MRKATSKFSDHAGSHRRGKDKNERTRVGEDAKALHKDSYHVERRESSREKGHGFSEDIKSRKRWDSDVNSKVEDSSYVGKSERGNETVPDCRHEANHERSASPRLDVSEGKDIALDSAYEKGKSSREERRADSGRSRSRSRSDAVEGDDKATRLMCEDRTVMEKTEKHRDLRTSDAIDSRDRLRNPEEDNNLWLRDKTAREVAAMGATKTWSERPIGRTGNRKDGRSEAVKASSNFGISTENYDVIEIQPKPLNFEYGRDNPASAFSRRSEAVPLHDPKSAKHDDWVRLGDDVTRTYAHGQLEISHDPSRKYTDEIVSAPVQNLLRDDLDGRAGRLRSEQRSFSPQPSSGRSSSGSSQPPHSNQEHSTFGKVVQQSAKVNRPGRGGRVRAPGRDSQQVGMPVPLMGPPFGHLGMPPPGPTQPINSGMSPGPSPPIPLVSLFLHFPHLFGQEAGIDMSMLPISPGVSIPPGRPGQPYSHSIRAPSNPALYFNQSGQGRGMPPNASGLTFSASVPVGRGNSNGKSSGAWIPPKTGGAPGKAPSGGEQNDYSQNFVDIGMGPQNFIREFELTNIEDYPKLRGLIQKKEEIVANAATPPMYYKWNLREFELSLEFFGTKFDVILVDPPWEEYVHRAPGVTDHMEYWTFEEIQNLKIEAIADTPSFVFPWVGDGVGLEQGRQCLKKWGFRRCEDICWVKTNKHTATPALRHDSYTLFQHSKEHCLMGIKGSVRCSSDGHIIRANIDTDVIIAEEPRYGMYACVLHAISLACYVSRSWKCVRLIKVLHSALPYSCQFNVLCAVSMRTCNLSATSCGGSTAEPEEMYRIIEHFALGRRRIELLGEDHNIRTGWLTVGYGLSLSNFNAEDGKVWHGGGGRNPPPDAPHHVQTTPEIESLRPKSPMKNQQQMQQSSSISLSTTSSGSRRAAGNSPQNPTAFSLNQEASTSTNPWASPMEVFRGPANHAFDMYGYNMQSMHPNGEYLDFESQRMMNMM
ncbi:hypothetical protein Cgig2_007865 [Carnegiea gigantea]|uniref:Uncharacterized protein n=1 Tax=Carnegiea gigantea TaxID=171969 RepID=A0A9Q1KF17_9CARY|nr:hypothetical protein Cgig2_007865 [Carnegiea gigantea]